MRAGILIAFSLILFAACTVKPTYVLSEKKMENVLFDLYIAQTEISENTTSLYADSASKRKLLQSVLKKHRITQEKLDTSLVWYNAHIERYMNINKQLTERYNLLIDKLQAEIERRERRFQTDTLRWEDLNLKNFIQPFLFPWLTDTVALGLNIEPIAPDIEPVAPDIKPDTLPPTDSGLSNQQRAVPVAQKTEVVQESVVIDPAPVAIRKGRDKQQQRTFRLMKVRDDSIHHPKVIPGSDENLSPSSQ